MTMPGIHLGLKGSYRVSILDSRSKLVVYESPWRPNIILNDGMERIAVANICDCFLYGCAGTGTRTDNVSGGVTTAATSGASVTLTGGAFIFDTGTPGDVGNIIKWNNTGFEGRITAVADTTHCTITPTPGSAQTGNFVLYRTNQTGLQTEVKRSTTYVPLSDFCNSTRVGGVLTHTRTWDFTAESGNVTYNEVGTAWTSTVSEPNVTFSRMNLSVPVSLVSGQQLRLQYRLDMQLVPSVSTAKTANISGWPVAPATDTAGDESFAYVGLSSVATSGATGVFDTANVSNEPSGSSNVSIWISPSSAALTALGVSPPDRSTNSTSQAVTLVAYTTLSFVRIKQITFSSGEANRTDLRSMGMGTTISGNNPATVYGIAFVFDQSQTKDNAHSLNLQWIYSWSRVLTP